MLLSLFFLNEMQKSTVRRCLNNSVFFACCANALRSKLSAMRLHIALAAITMEAAEKHVKCFVTSVATRDAPRQASLDKRTKPITLHRAWPVAQPNHNFFWGGKIFYFERATVFCLGYRLSKREMTRYARKLGGQWPPGCAFECGYSWLILSVDGPLEYQGKKSFFRGSKIF